MSTVTPSVCRAARRRYTSSVTRILLVLDPSVLKPDFDLLLGELKRGGNLNAAQAGQVHAGSELLLETQ